jgi:processive 1,2-diacylglycerol beta-glucosyltransferase
VPDRSVLLLSSKFGEGHLKAGEALTTIFERSNFAVRHLDFGALFFRKTDFVMRSAYMNMIRKTPRLWRLIYDKTSDSKLEGYNKIIHKINSRDLLSYIRESKPEAIVCTHFFPAGILSGMKRRGLLSVPLVTVVTDYLVHRIWASQGTDLYLVGCRDAYSRLVKAGIQSSKIKITGIPVRVCFEETYSKTVCKRRLQLDPEKLTVLIMGVTGIFARKKIAVLEALFNLADTIPVQFVVICGSDKESFAFLKCYADREHGIKILGYIENIHEYMAASDLIISKGGALTISEALTIGLPVIIYKPIPGHETGNAVFVEQGGAGKMISFDEELVSQVAYLLSDQSKLTEMSLAARNLVPRHSAENGVKAILSLLPEGKCIREYQSKQTV